MPSNLHPHQTLILFCLLCGFACTTHDAHARHTKIRALARAQLCRDGLAEGMSNFKIKVGADIEDDIRRAQIIREEIGPDRKLMMDANQRWDVGPAIEFMKRLAVFKPTWIEEPTSPDDVLGHAAIAKALKP